MTAEPEANEPLSAELLDRIQVEFPQVEHGEVERLLLEYQGGPGRLSTGEGHVNRVRGAVLELAEGNLAWARHHMRNAKTDWRDLFLTERVEAAREEAGPRADRYQRTTLDALCGRISRKGGKNGLSASTRSSRAIHP
ncbi:MAG TPA: hypothetical protein VMM83_03035 [Longimicrobiales bacterium]|nr:hypothetical protein [Longimicrobiales bacterium]